MGLISSIVVSVIVLVIALVIFQFIINPYYFNSFKQSVTHGASGIVNSAQNASVKAIVATQSNKSILYVGRNGNNSIAVFDTQYRRIVDTISLDGESLNDLALSQNNYALYATGSYYNYHTPQYHGVIYIISVANNTVIGTVLMNSTPTKIIISPNDNYAYTINENQSLSEINLDNETVINTIPLSSFLNVTQYPPQIRTPTSYCYFNNTSSNVLAFCNGTSSPPDSVNKWTVQVFSVPDIIQSYLIFEKNYSTLSFSDNYSLPNSPYVNTPQPYQITLTAYTSNSTLHYYFFQYNSTTKTPKISKSAHLINILYSLNGTRLYVTANYTYQNIFNSTIFVINTQNNQVIKRIELNSYPDYSWKNIALSPDGSKLYILGGNGNSDYLTLYTLNASTQSLLENVTISSYSGAASMSVTPLGDYIYVMDNAGSNIYGNMGNNLFVINTASDSVVDSKSIGSNLADIEVNNSFGYLIDGNQLFTISRLNDSIVNSTGISGCPCEIVN